MKLKSLLTGLVLLLSANTPLAETLNRVVAVVNDDVILESELSSRETMIVDQLRQQQAQLPSRPSLRKQVLDRLVLENLQLQLAGYQPWSQDVTLDATEARSLPATLIGLPASLVAE